MLPTLMSASIESTPCPKVVLPFSYRCNLVQDEFTIFSDCKLTELAQGSPLNEYEQISYDRDEGVLYLESNNGDDMGTLRMSVEPVTLSYVWVYRATA